MSPARRAPERWLDRLHRRYLEDADGGEAQELRRQVDAQGAVPIDRVKDRAQVELVGVLRSLTHPPAGADAPAQVGELYDGTGAVDIVWLGRRSVPGIRPGVRLRVRGRIAVVGEGSRTMYNPRYEILPAH